MQTYRISTLALAGLFVASSSAFAATRNFTIAGNLIENNTGATPSAVGITFPSGVDSSGAINFLIPKDYKKNSTIKLKVRYLLGVGACSIELTVDGAVRLRVGAEPSIGLGPASGAQVSGSAVVTLTSMVPKSFVKEITVKPVGSGSIANQKAGDNVIVVFGRNGTSGSDTCAGSAAATSVKVEYTTN